MTEPTVMSRALAARVTAATRLPPWRSDAGTPALPAGLLADVREALLGGDTHYTSRPGSPVLRAAIARSLAACGYPHASGDTDLVITAGVEEALTVVALSLVRGPVAVEGGAVRAAAALTTLGFTVQPAADPQSPLALVYTTTGRAGWAPDHLIVRDVGSSMWGPAPPAFAAGDVQTIVIGDLDALPGLATFRVGFAAAPAALMRGIRTWKQALSICTAAPSQRAAIWALTDAAGKEPR